MSFLSRLIPGNDAETRELLKKRRSGEQSQARLGFSQARQANAATAQSTAARAADAGMTPAAAQRLASQQQAASNAGAGQQFQASRMGEVQQAEAELARMREQRAAFGRQLFGGLMNAGAGIATQLGLSGGASQVQMTGADADGVRRVVPQDNGLGGIAQIAGTAAGGPMGGALAGRLFGGGMGGAMAQVDQAIGPQTPVSNEQLLGAVPTQARPAPGPDPSMMTDEEFRRWLASTGGGQF